MSIEAMKQAIEACPFCGSKDVKVHPPYGMHEAFAQCNNCCVTGPDGATESEAVLLWNTRTAIQQAESEPVYWEWRHQGSHPDAVDFGQWSEWKRVEPRSALHTVEDALNEFRGYIARGHKYELRALYTHPAPGVPEFSRIAKRKLTDLQEQGFAITGYAIQRGPVRGFIDGGGFVGWWQGEPDPGVPDDVVRDAERYRELVRSGRYCPASLGTHWALATCSTRPSTKAELDAPIDAMLAASPAQKGGE